MGAAVTQEEIKTVLFADENVERLRELVAGDTARHQAKSEDDKKAELLDRNTDFVYQVFRNNGWDSPTKQFRWSKVAEREENRITYHKIVKRLHELDSGTGKDALDPFDRSLVIPRVITRIIREAIEPRLVLAPLFTTIRFSGAPTIEFPEFGTLKASEIGPSGEYPEESFELGGHMVMVRIAKYGLAVRITDEMVKYSQWDLMRMALVAGGRALARLREAKAFEQIDRAATFFDNQGFFTLDFGVGPAIGPYTTTGRARNATNNGTYTLRDMFSQWVDLYQKGFTPDLLIMNPMGWLIFAINGEMRAMLHMHGPAFMAQAPQGQIGRNREFETGLLGQLGEHAEVPEFGTQFSQVPQFFPVPLRTVVSPFVSFGNDVNGTPGTNIYMADSSEIGIIVRDEDVMTEEWNDPSRDIRKVKLRERYGFATLREGKGLNVARRVVVGKSYDFDERIVWDAATASLPATTGAPAPYVQ